VNHNNQGLVGAQESMRNPPHTFPFNRPRLVLKAKENVFSLMTLFLKARLDIFLPLLATCPHTHVQAHTYTHTILAALGERVHRQ